MSAVDPSQVPPAGSILRHLAILPNYPKLFYTWFYGFSLILKQFQTANRSYKSKRYAIYSHLVSVETSLYSFSARLIYDSKYAD
jgi:hypothetical protein